MVSVASVPTRCWLTVTHPKRGFDNSSSSSADCAHQVSSRQESIFKTIFADGRFSADHGDKSRRYKSRLKFDRAMRRVEFREAQWNEIFERVRGYSLLKKKQCASYSTARASFEEMMNPGKFLLDLVLVNGLDLWICPANVEYFESLHR
jgi:hypothetical protein